MEYQLATWGDYSEQIADYTKKGLIRQGNLNPREALLISVVDPFTYRRQLTLPKLLINGTNDRYWVVDAAKLYWDDLAGPKYTLEIPNAGHGLDGGRDVVLATIAAFFRHAVAGTPWPSLDWSETEGEKDLSLSVRSTPKPKTARLWIAHSPTKDLRDAKWHCEPLGESSDGFVAKVPKPPQGHVAFYGELQFEQDGLPYSLCTLVRRY